MAMEVVMAKKIQAAKYGITNNSKSDGAPIWLRLNNRGTTHSTYTETSAYTIK